MFTQFEREQGISTLRGKLDDGLLRVRKILEQASGDSLVILNEIFASAMLGDAISLRSEYVRGTGSAAAHRPTPANAR